MAGGINFDQMGPNQRQRNVAMALGMQNQGHGNGLTGDINQLYNQQQQAAWQNAPSLWQTLLGMGGYGYDLGGALDGAMGQIGNTLNANADRNVATNQIMSNYHSMVDPVQIQQSAETARVNAQEAAKTARMNSLLSAMFGGGGGNAFGSGGSGGLGGGLGGFRAVDGNGNPSSSATLPGAGGGTAGGGSTGGQLGANQGPGAQPTNTANFQPSRNNPNSPGYYDGLSGGYGQRVSPEDAAKARAYYAQHGTYGRTPYANIPQGIFG